MTQTQITPDWIAADWGTTTLRVWAMSASGTVLAEACAEHATGPQTQGGFTQALLTLVQDWLHRPTPVIACGAVDPRTTAGVTAYATAPCASLPETLVQMPAPHPHLTVFAIPGIKQDTPAGVMQGAETKVAGFLARNKNWDGVICQPGSHTTWAQISADEIVSFQTFMTGDLIQAISQHTVLNQTVADTAWDDGAFAQGLDQGLSRPERLAARLSALHAETLLHRDARTSRIAHLTGLLIGTELAAAKPYWLGQNIAVIGGTHLAQCYVDALSTQGAPATIVKEAPVTLAGLGVAYLRHIAG